MSDHYFVSYSRLDGADFALRLADELQATPPPYPLWVDTREMQAGRKDWDDQLVEAIQSCRGLLFVMTSDSVRLGSGTKDEWVWALKYKKPVIPVRLGADVELPFRLSSRQFVDFSRDFDTGLAQLRNYLRWTSTPEGVLQELQNRLADAERELPRADPAQQARIQEEIEQLRRRIDEQQQLVEDPQAAREQTEARIATGLERQRQPERPVTAAPRAKFVNPPPMIAPGYFQDRHVETGLIGEFLRTDGLRLMSVVGRGGVGKTAMVCRLLKGLEVGRLPDDLGELAVDGIVYLSPIGAHAVNFPNLFTDLCRLLPEGAAEPLLARYREPRESPASLMLGLLECFPAGLNVALLDNFEDLLDHETLEITDQALDEALRTLLSAPEHGVKVILTSRAAPRSLLLVQPGVQRRLDLDAGLKSPYAEELLRKMDTSGSLGLRDAPDALLENARERTRGFPRALEALAAILAADRDTTLPELLADAERMPENVVEALVGEAFNRLDPLAQQVMQALAIYTVPVPPVAVDYMLQPYRPAIDSAPVLSRLVNMQFARRDGGNYYLHQVDRDYALHRVPPSLPGAVDGDALSFSQYSLRIRGADYFEQTRTARETWRSLDDLAPQLAEFQLRHEAGDYDTAAQVLFEIDFDYLILWGHYRLTIDLHQRLYERLTDPENDAISKINLASCYSALGKIQRAIELYEQSLAIFREIGSREGEAANLGNLGNCYRALGRSSARSSSTSRHSQSTARSAAAKARRPPWATSVAATSSWGRSSARSSSTSSHSRSIARSATAETRRPPWATSVTATTTWERSNARSSSTSRHSRSTARSAAAEAKRTTWATSVAATAPWGRSSARSSSTSRHSRSTARSATAEAKHPTWTASVTATATWGDPARDRVVRAGTRDQPRDRQPRRRSGQPGQPR